MTIRYACSECDSVLKIRDELAGTKAKCPKCKTPFVIPNPQLMAVAETVAAEPPVDMPLKITPPVNPEDTDLYDTPAAEASSVDSALAKTPSEAKPKPSVAELMREHEASRKKNTDRKNKGGMEAAAAVAELVTSGSAADALTRTYDQKRGKSSDPPPLTREEQRAAEEKEALKNFAMKGGAGLAAVLVVGYFLISWAMSESLPDLEYGYGVVTLDNAPVVGARVQFAPTKVPGSPENQISTPSVGNTDASGNFVLMWDPVNSGVLPGKHTVTIMDINGGQYPLSDTDRQKEVVVGGDNVFNFSLSSGR